SAASHRQSNKLGDVGTSKEKPVMNAPCRSSQRVSQEPLKPVCPVMKTRRPWKKFRLAMMMHPVPFSRDAERSAIPKRFALRLHGQAFGSFLFTHGGRIPNSPGRIVGGPQVFQ